MYSFAINPRATRLFPVMHTGTFTLRLSRLAHCAGQFIFNTTCQKVLLVSITNVMFSAPAWSHKIGLFWPIANRLAAIWFIWFTGALGIACNFQIALIVWCHLATAQWPLAGHWPVAALHWVWAWDHLKSNKRSMSICLNTNALYFSKKSPFTWKVLAPCCLGCALSMWHRTWPTVLVLSDI